MAVTELAPATRDGAAVYARAALAEIPRILGLGDREPQSATFGCFDRYYWHYRLLDFPNARFQEVAVLLALLYRHEIPGNPLFQHARVLEWLRGVLGFWTSQRNRDGSVNEAYPNERSFCATAFSFAAVTETHLLLGWEFSAEWERTTEWLGRQNSRDVPNQAAAAALALLNCSLLTGKPRYGDLAREKVAGVQATQDRYGCFPEYGGPDVGYHTLTLSLLARIWKKTEDSSLLPTLTRAVTFADERIGEDGRFDYSRSSRRTQFLYPSGFALLGSGVVGRHVEGLQRGVVLQPAWLDDRYTIQLTTDYLRASLAMRQC